MNCGDCQYLGRNCGGLEGNPGTPTIDPMSMSSRQLVDVACAIARLGTLLCDIGRVSVPATGDIDPPYIWDIKEE